MWPNQLTLLNKGAMRNGNISKAVKGRIIKIVGA